MATPAEPPAVSQAALDNEEEVVSPKTKTATFELAEGPSMGPMSSVLTARADPDAQTTVTDFLDFTEYLPADMVRSLTLIGKLDQRYADASHKVDDLTTLWGQLPGVPTHERPSPVQLRADISEHLKQALDSRIFAHAEAMRMADNVHRHYNKATALLSKLKTMMENYPTEEQAPAEMRSPQMTRAKLTVRATGEDGQRVRRSRVPRITVPGEVLAPYEIEYDTFSDDSDISSDEESEPPVANRRILAPTPRIKLVSNKSQKSTGRSSRGQYATPALSAAAAANAAALLNPPPENAVIGSPDAPWLQLTQYELAKLRKRMKKNATWTPSETMIARELKALGRGPDAYREAKKKAEEEGRVFEATVPTPIIDNESGTRQMPAGAISVDSLAAAEVPTSNRGMKLNEAKKLKREQLAKLAAEEAEESARKMQQAAKLFLGGSATSSMTPENAKSPGPQPKPRANSRSKRKRDEGESNGEVVAAAAAEGGEASSSSRPPAKRTKTETPVPPPVPGLIAQSSSVSSDNSAPPGAATSGASAVPQSETPVPIPIPPQSSVTTRSATSPAPASIPANTSTVNVTTPGPVKAPFETPVPLPKTEPRVSTTPIPPPTIRELPGREASKRETRGDAAKRSQQQQLSASTSPQLQRGQSAAPETAIKQSSSRGGTPRLTPGPEPLPTRRPGSRGKAASQEPQPSLAVDRSRRASTARNTPVPELKQPGKRTKRPAPGVVSTTSSGGNSAVGKRKAAPKKKARATKRDKGQVTEEMVEVDDEGNPIDPDEPR
ncbi:phd finger domain-containing, partial [Trichoderma arundinaceum]